jgi:hypothetical protein
MKPRFWLSVAIFVSAYAPLALLFAIRDFDSQKKWFGHPPFVWASLGTALVSVILLFFTMRSVRGQFAVKINKVSLRSNDLLNYSIPYLISFFSVDFGKPQDLGALALFMSLLFFLSLKTQSIFINPVLALRGWGLYEVEFEESGNLKNGVFLAKIELQPTCRFKMDRISQFLYVATAKIEEN